MSIFLGLLCLVCLCAWLLKRSKGGNWGKIASNISYSHRGVNAVTRRKLLKLLGNHQPTVNRLLQQAKLRNPGESEQWYWEKVLYDLERDRWR
jgi:hypothetical protein